MLSYALIRCCGGLVSQRSLLSARYCIPKLFFSDVATVISSSPEVVKKASSKKKKQKTYPALPEISEDDIEEKFVRGTGPGGQKINKTSIVAQLKHLPSGIQVSCQETRSLQQNRSIARKRLREKVDAHINGDESRVMAKVRESVRKKRSADKKKSKKYRNLELAKAASAQEDA
ncbi:RF-1 domain-domain-containing protein [Protomyces lactucae-debilis]|uniref:RF-1 domain-domain-containing protein n=1 Tax=Protomyces lactucae-debilis TaxID=2754530 RepID=A0A1Y2FUL4_PROLT|nr:RF-1 domain-containing protein [Protomyces lactucae-debilis]ORY87649.1 RF-1 domain-domain-containing protein [Protomyces lactucae-debilis]